MSEQLTHSAFRSKAVVRSCYLNKQTSHTHNPRFRLDEKMDVISWSSRTRNRQWRLWVSHELYFKGTTQRIAVLVINSQPVWCYAILLKHDVYNHKTTKKNLHSRNWKICYLYSVFSWNLDENQLVQSFATW